MDKVNQAPHTEIIWLEAGHSLNGDNLGQFVDVMLKVLKQTYSTASFGAQQ